jgi:hypothetical protein
VRVSCENGPRLPTTSPSCPRQTGLSSITTTATPATATTCSFQIWVSCLHTMHEWPCVEWSAGSVPLDNHGRVQVNTNHHVNCRPLCPQSGRRYQRSTLPRLRSCRYGPHRRAGPAAACRRVTASGPGRRRATSRAAKCLVAGGRQGTQKPSGAKCRDRVGQCGTHLFIGRREPLCNGRCITHRHVSLLAFARVLASLPPSTADVGVTFGHPAPSLCRSFTSLGQDLTKAIVVMTKNGSPLETTRIDNMETRVDQMVWRPDDDGER